MSRRLLLLAVGATVLALCACASTPFISTWTAPDAQSLNPAGRTIAVVFVSRDESQRREDGEATLARLEEAGVNGVVVMRIVGKDQRITYTPNYAVLGSYNGFGPYWDYGWDTVYEPGSLQTDAPVSIETLVCSLDRGGKLVWASASHTINPGDLDGMISRVADATVKEMVRDRRPPALFLHLHDTR